MPKTQSETQLKPKRQIEEREILSLIRSVSDGVAISELMLLAKGSFSRRTLQRRLEGMLVDQCILSRGEGRGRRYYANKSDSGMGLAMVSGAIDGTGAGGEDYAIVPSGTSLFFAENALLSLSATDSGSHLCVEAQELKKQMSQPLGDRIPVGYNPRFLMDYIPNQSFYLPASTRVDLFKMGKVGVSELPAGTYLRQILDRILIDLSWNSSRLEGNTYSLLETERLLKMGELVNGKETQETQMILNHKSAIEMLADQAEEIGFNRYTVCNLHAMLSDNLLSDSAACGRLRDRPVGIGGSVFRPLEVPQLIDEYFQLILIKAEQINDPYEASFFVMVHLPYLQAFEDVNKRVSRLAANIPLIWHNLCPLSFVDVETQDYLGGLIAVYELNRIEYLRDVYVWAYQRSCLQYKAVRQSLGEPDPFRLKYRTAIGDCVRTIVESNILSDNVESAIRDFSGRCIDAVDQDHFSQVILVELQALHEGNIARYRIRPRVFEAWGRV